jgi:hypothetical protein
MQQGSLSEGQRWSEKENGRRTQMAAALQQTHQPPGHTWFPQGLRAALGKGRSNSAAWGEPSPPGLCVTFGTVAGKLKSQETQLESTKH